MAVDRAEVEAGEVVRSQQRIREVAARDRPAGQHGAWKARTEQAAVLEGRAEEICILEDGVREVAAAVLAAVQLRVREVTRVEPAVDRPQPGKVGAAEVLALEDLAVE